MLEFRVAFFVLRSRIDLRLGIFCYGLTNIEKAKKEAFRSAARVSDQLMKVVDGGVHEIFIIEKRIKVETRALESTVMRFLKQTNQWLAASHAINTAVKVSLLSSFFFTVCRIIILHTCTLVCTVCHSCFEVFSFKDLRD